MKLAFVLLIAGVFAGTFLEANNLKGIEGQTCSTGGDVYSITEFDVTPNPPQKNSALSLKMSGTVSQNETLKSLDVFVIYNGINFYQEGFPESGTYSAEQSANISVNVFLPSIAPPGNYAVQTKLKNAAGTYLNCWEYKFSL